MSTKLKAKDPAATEPRKPQIVIYGPPGVGKTWFSLSFTGPVYYIDTEGGASRAHYMDRLKAGGGAYLGPEDGSNDFETIIGQVKALATEKHDFKTVVIDSITKPFISAIASEGERLGEKNAFGADKKPAIQSMRRLIAAVHRLDMAVIFVAHEKADWGEVNGQRTEIGKAADVYDKLIYEMDLALQIVKRGPARTALVKKSRLLGFPEGESFTLDFTTFAERYGRDVIERAPTQIVLATAQQVAEINRLTNLLKTDAATIEKWLDKANAENFAELNTSQASKIIDHLNKQLQ